jgi:hypothetical protein
MYGDFLGFIVISYFYFTPPILTQFRNRKDNLLKLKIEIRVSSIL